MVNFGARMIILIVTKKNQINFYLKNPLLTSLKFNMYDSFILNIFQSMFKVLVFMFLYLYIVIPNHVILLTRENNSDMIVILVFENVEKLCFVHKLHY